MSWIGTGRLRSMQKEREQLRALKVLADAYPVLEPAANLVARSRLQLEKRWMRSHRSGGMNAWASG